MTLTIQEQTQALRMTQAYLAWRPYLNMDPVTPEQSNLILGACQYHVMPLHSQLTILNMIGDRA